MRQIIPETDKPGRVLVGVFTLLFLLMMWPYAMPLFWALILTVLLQPLWNRWEKHSSLGPIMRGLLMSLAILLVLVIPVILLVLALPGQIQQLIDEFPRYAATFTRMFHDLLDYLPPSIAQELQTSVSEQSRNNVGTIGKAAVDVVTFAATSTLTLFVHFTLMLYVLFFFLIDGKQIYARVRSYMPFDDDLMDQLAERFVAITKATVGGVFIIAIAQGIVAGLCFWILGVQAAIALGLATTAASLIPAVGSGIVWIPVAIYLAVNGSLAKGVILVLLGLFVIGMVDNLLRPRLVGRGTKIPDFVVLLTTLGGLSLLGAAGIVLGPMIAGLCISLWQMTKPQPEEGEILEAAATSPKPRRKTKGKA